MSDYPYKALKRVNLQLAVFTPFNILANYKFPLSGALYFQGGLALRHIIIIFTLISLVGCAAALVPYTSDPRQKIADAYWLFDKKSRPLPAEKLIYEAIAIYQENNNEVGLAEGYVAYAIFLRSYSVSQYRDRYEDKGFIDESATFENRFSKSMEYLRKSENIYQTLSKYDDLTNTYLHMAFTSMAADDKINACKYYDKSIEANITFMSQNPDAKISLAGYKSYKDYIKPRKEEAECST
jgi:tetratricopeptide (TPR) repeat protein